MNEVIRLLLELQGMVNQGYNIDDAKLDLAMQTLQNAHDNSVDNQMLLNREQRKHRKELYKDCVKAMKKYVKQCLLDDKDIREQLIKQQWKNI